MNDDNASDTVVGELCLALGAPPLGDGAGLEDRNSSLAVVLIDRSAVEALERRIRALAADVTSEYLASLRPGVEPEQEAVRPLAVSVDDAFRDSAAQHIAEHRETVAKQLGHERLEMTLSVHAGEPGQTDLLSIASLSVQLPAGGIERFIELLQRGDFYAAPRGTGNRQAGKPTRTLRGHRVPADPEQNEGPRAAATVTGQKRKRDAARVAASD